MISSALIGESKRCSPDLNATPDLWRVDETYVKVKKLILVVGRQELTSLNSVANLVRI